jgi:putative SOS response-associated peptidase YedK
MCGCVLTATTTTEAPITNAANLKLSGYWTKTGAINATISLYVRAHGQVAPARLMMPENGSMICSKSDRCFRETFRMCAEFITSSVILDYARSHQIPISLKEDSIKDGTHVLPHSHAPVLIHTPKGAEVRSMVFSLTPSWSKERRVPFATFNARLDSLASKPTWRVPFARHRALVPMQGFIEPCYSGPFAGTMVRFCPQQQTSILPPALWAAAVFDRWIDPHSKEELLSFAIITDTPGAAVASIAHDRQPLLIRTECKDSWLDPTLIDPQTILTLIPEIRAAEALLPEVDRHMKPGWEKRRSGAGVAR